MVERDMVFVRDCAWAKLFGMLTITVGVFLLVIAGLDASVEALLSGSVLVPFGIVFACLDEKMTISFQDKAIFREYFSWGWNLAFFNKTVYFHEIRHVMASGSFLRKSDRFLCGINFETSKGRIFYDSAVDYEARELYVELLKKSGLPAGPNPWKIVTENAIAHQSAVADISPKQNVSHPQLSVRKPGAELETVQVASFQTANRKKLEAESETLVITSEDLDLAEQAQLKTLVVTSGDLAQLEGPQSEDFAVGKNGVCSGKVLPGEEVNRKQQSAGLAQAIRPDYPGQKTQDHDFAEEFELPPQTINAQNIGLGPDRYVRHADGTIVPVPIFYKDGVFKLYFSTIGYKPWGKSSAPLNLKPVFTFLGLILVALFGSGLVKVEKDLNLFVFFVIVFCFGYTSREYNSSKWIDQIEIEKGIIRFKTGLDRSCEWEAFPLETLHSVRVVNKKAKITIQDPLRMCLEFCFENARGGHRLVHSGWGWSPETLHECVLILEDIQRDPYFRESENILKHLGGG